MYVRHGKGFQQRANNKKGVEITRRKQMTPKRVEIYSNLYLC
jgi:hypothetical protein